MKTTSLPALAGKALAYVTLQREVHDALLAQHPEWIEPGGDSPTCDSYDARFAELLMALPGSGALTRGTTYQPQLQFQYLGALA
jgi:hypothetical protein